jgi:hypothetical protein
MIQRSKWCCRGKVPIGIATLAAGNGTATVRVRLDGIATAAA